MKKLLPYLICLIFGASLMLIFIKPKIPIPITQSQEYRSLEEAKINVEKLIEQEKNMSSNLKSSLYVKQKECDKLNEQLENYKKEISKSESIVEHITVVPEDCKEIKEKYESLVNSKDKEITTISEINDNKDKQITLYKAMMENYELELGNKDTIIEDLTKERDLSLEREKDLDKKIKWTIWKGRGQGFMIGITGGWLVGKVL